MFILFQNAFLKFKHRSGIHSRRKFPLFFFINSNKLDVRFLVRHNSKSDTTYINFSIFYIYYIYVLIQICVCLLIEKTKFWELDMNYSYPTLAKLLAKRLQKRHLFSESLHQETPKCQETPNISGNTKHQSASGNTNLFSESLHHQETPKCSDSDIDSFSGNCSTTL